jgi:uncharacterized membrane protein
MDAWIKLVHLFAVTMFLGNVVTGLFWHAHAARTRDPRLLAHTMDGIIRSDRWFTNPGALLVVVAGVAGALVRGLPLLGTDWILGAIVLFSVSGAVFALRVAPLQRQLLAMARAGERGEPFEYARYHALARRWEAWGALALATPLAAFVLMVLKPGR